MVALKELHLETVLTSASFQSFIAEAQRFKTELFPKVELLSLKSFENGENALPFFEAISENGVFLDLKKLWVATHEDKDGSPSFQGSCLALSKVQGAFAGLEELRFARMDITDAVQLEELCLDSEGTPCMKNPQRLLFCECRLSSDAMRSLGTLFRRGGLPSLQKLSMKELHKDTKKGLSHLLEGFEAAGRSLALAKNLTFPV